MLAKVGISVIGEDDSKWSPLKMAWFESRLERDPFGGEWYVPTRRYWELFDANRNARWAEEVAWAAFQAPIPTDECMSDCQLRVIQLQSGQYWTRLPAGRHVHEVLKQGATRAELAAEYACYDHKPLGDSSSPVLPELVRQIRVSLANVAAAEKRDILKYLANAERKCGK